MKLMKFSQIPQKGCNMMIQEVFLKLKLIIKNKHGLANLNKKMNHLGLLLITENINKSLINIRMSGVGRCNKSRVQLLIKPTLTKVENRRLKRYSKNNKNRLILQIKTIIGNTNLSISISILLQNLRI